MLIIKSSDQAQLMLNGVLPKNIQVIDQRMRQPSRTRTDAYLRENFHRICLELTLINDDEEFDEINRNRSPPLSTSSTKPIFRTIEGNFIKHDNSVHEWDQNAFFFRLHWHPEHSTEKINKLRFRRFGISKFTITYIGSTTTSLYRILALTNIILAIYGIIYLYENSVV